MTIGNAYDNQLWDLAHNRKIIPRLHEPHLVTFGTTAKSIGADKGVQEWMPMFWVGIIIKSLGTAAHIYIGGKDVAAANSIDFTAVGSYQEFSSGIEGVPINAADIFVVGDAGATCTAVIIGMDVIDLGDKPKCPKVA